MLLLLCTVLSFLSTALTADTVTVSVSATAPDGVSPTIDSSFSAFAFEERSFYNYAGPAGQPCVLSQNLVLGVANRTNSRPVIRVGGSSLERSKYDQSQSEAMIVPESQQTESIPTGVSFGPSFFDSFKNFPSAMYIVDIPMGKSTSVTETVAFASAAYKTIGGENIIALEPGNEPNSYLGYTATDYTDDFNTYSTAVSSALGISVDDPRWMVGSIGVGYNAVEWNASNLFTSGFDQVSARISSFSVHFYQYARRSTLDVSSGLMSHDAVVSKFVRYGYMIDYLSSRSPSLPFSFAEVGCGLGNLAQNTSILERSFGAALWQVDFMLYTMAQGVHRVNMQSGLGFEFSLWQPVEWEGASAAVFANYYASVFAADFLGSTGAAQSINIDLNSDTLSAYAVYESGSLARVALVNMNYWDDSSSSEDRSTTTFSIQASGYKNVTVMRFTSTLGAGAFDSTDITWGGESWDIAHDGIAQKTLSDTTVVDVEGGVASVDVLASEAVLVLFKADSASSTQSTTSASATSSATSSAGSTATSTAASTGQASGTTSSSGSQSTSAASAANVMNYGIASICCILAAFLI